MKRFFRVLKNDALWRHSALMFASSVVVNVLSLAYWLLMVRRLSPEDYGTLNALAAVLIFVSVPIGVLQTVVTRYISKFMAHRLEDDARSMLGYFAKAIGFFLAFFFLALIVAGRQVVHFLQISELGLIYVVGIGLIFSSLASLTVATLSGLQMFVSVASNSVAAGFVKLISAFLLVASGFKVLGALLALVFSSLTSFAYSLFQLPSWARKIKTPKKSSTLDMNEIYGYFLPVGACMLCFTALTTMDVVLVKHFFSPEDAGYYSVAQTVGKIVLSFPAAFGVVMFPKVVDSHAKNGDTRDILKKCVTAVGLLCACATFFSFLFPGMIMRILTGRTLPQAVPLVKFFALSMSFFALVNIFMLYNLSLKRMKYIYLLAVATLVEFAGIWAFHATLDQVLAMLLGTSALLFGFGLMTLDPGGAR